MSNKEEETCQECRFWMHTGGERGDCHEGPQIWQKGINDWCGRFKIKKPESKPMFPELSRPSSDFSPDQMPETPPKKRPIKRRKRRKKL